MSPNIFQSRLIKIEWLIANVTLTEWNVAFWRLCQTFLANSVRFVVREPLYDVCRNPLLNPNNFTQGHLLKTKWSIANIIVVVSPDVVEIDILGLFRSFLTKSSRFVDPVAILQPFWFVGKLIFRWLVLDVQSSCRTFLANLGRFSGQGATL